MFEEKEIFLYAIIFEEAYAGNPMIFKTKTSAEKYSKIPNIRPESDRILRRFRVSGWEPGTNIYLVVDENWYGGSNIALFSSIEHAEEYLLNNENKHNRMILTLPVLEIV